MPPDSADQPGVELTRFTAEYPFALDDFQLRACRALENGHGVLVCAPTGAGKTVVGEFAVHLALAAGGKCFYTTPIKALSNQKHNDLVARYGADKIGLLTGDQSINGDADIVVMTTEVLRNMLYANSPALQGLSYVVMDEVHFLADRMRGAVWEEVILHLPDEVLLVSLSATVSNAEEFGGWIQTVRGDTTVVVDEHRPVPLSQHMLVGRRLFDLFEGTNSSLVDPELLRHISHRREADRLADWQPRGRGRGRGGGGRPQLYRPPGRPDVIATLDAAGLLPAITFVFSRAGCDAAVQQCLRAPLRLTTDEERPRIAEIVDRRCADLAESDLIVLDYHQWREGLLRGLAAHHAGMLPVFRHTVEELFTAGLVKAVFATETLALGINMPARTVVLERLVKFNGEQHVPLTPGEYTQLTGRAGRRGIDVEGHAVVLWRPDDSNAEPAEVAGLASTRTFPLRSSFAPSYNMTINLVQQMGPEQAHRLLERSFAQYQADRSVVGLVRGIARGERMMGELAAEFGGKDAPILDYVRLRAKIGERERAQSRASRLQRRRAATDALAALRRGDIITITQGRRGGLAVVLEAAQRDSDDPRPLVLTEHRWAGRISSADYSGASAPLGTMALPKRVEHRQPRVRRDLASALRSAAADLSVPSKRAGRGAPAPERDVDPELAGLRDQLRHHPAHQLPDREAQARIAERYLRIERDNAQIQQKVNAATNSLARTFDRIVALLSERGFVESVSGEPRVTDAGRLLARIYSESDLLVAECLRAGVWDGLQPAELAGVLSAVLFESRGDTAGGTVGVDIPTAGLRRALAQTRRVSADLRGDEQRHRLAPSREPDEGFVTAVYRWATTGDLGAALAASDAGGSGSALSAGDFVRWCRQVLDLLDQVRNAAPTPALRNTAKRAVNDVRRGVVAVDAG
ncbi:DEAD/DEAH box helicase [Mycolicibacterium conceptionense]|jgi:ATP-dependent RNA helicase HelY|uniref:DEAD/DEAH box helicase n=2 Tax=Mycolicibacterium TaxID=1866885 RepID=A0ABR5FN87_9MYCO|nr:MULTISPECIES: RNA helicase [Mycolicibacterium]KLI07852.1 DEAD/DEAH box helicase [Mycolicibacterium senegalense]KLO48285.1 DEAD/DEAH box helicase [Mycolicibacterium senegalense]KMV20554.1 DEAD/DEAH box helicase [Mycolicibacterium conceptionense]OBJ91929.1 DEAD/DEAH box helicase [Mycolicibacterium conceptionense]OMB68240.1 DEAD/DEAH box helicase [Mycolicibacterium conceptionense]